MIQQVFLQSIPTSNLEKATTDILEENHYESNYQEAEVELTRKARDAGRDAACIFRSLVQKDAKEATVMAKKVFLYQCPYGFWSTGVAAFNSEVERKAIACIAAGKSKIEIVLQHRAYGDALENFSVE